MTPQVSYFRRYPQARLDARLHAPARVRARARALFVACGALCGLLASQFVAPADHASAKPMPAIESAWVVSQSELALDALNAIEDIDASTDLGEIEKRDLASKWVKSISKIVAIHLEIDSKKLERVWLMAGIDRQKVLLTALSQLGVPYKTNADQPGTALDCSALIKFAWSSVNLDLPRGSAQQYAFGERIKSSEAQLGDLAWYPGHIAMSLGIENVVIQAPTNGRNVEVHKIDETRVNWVRWVDPTQ